MIPELIESTKGPPASHLRKSVREGKESSETNLVSAKGAHFPCSESVLVEAGGRFRNAHKVLYKEVLHEDLAGTL